MKLFGIRIRIHPTFIWLLLFLLLVSAYQALAWIVLVFTFVVLHELSHSLVARAHGIPVQDITLLPIGGVARLGAMPEHAGTELAITIAGPVLNFVVAGVAYGILALTGSIIPGWLVGLFQKILVINLGLGTFNLLPGFPMDGGRLLRAYLARTRGYVQATHIAARVGRWMAAAFAIFGLTRVFGGDFGGLWLVLIAFFVYVSGKQEEMAVAARHGARGLWQLFGCGRPTDGAGPENIRAGNGERRSEPRTGGDVIDVEGEVRKPPDDGSAADAFRRLSEEIETHLKR